MRTALLPLEYLKPYLRLLELVVGAISFVLIIALLLIPLDTERRWQGMLLMVGTSLYNYIVLHYVIARYRGNRWLLYVFATFTALIVLGWGELLTFLQPLLDIVLALYVIMAAIVGGRRVSLYAALLSSLVTFAFDAAMTDLLAGGIEAVVRFVVFGAMGVIVWTVMERAIGTWRAASQRAEQRSSQTAQQLHEMQTLYELATAVGSSLDLREVLTLAVRKTIEALNMDAGFIALVDGDDQDVRLEVQSGFSESLAQQLAHSPLSVGEGLVGLAIENRAPIFSADIAHDSRAAGRLLANAGYHSAIAIPLTVGEQVIGVLSALSSAPHTPDTNELSFVEAIGEQVGLALLRARYFAQEQRQREWAQTLNRVAQALNTSFDLDTLLDSVLSELQGVFNYRSAAILLLQDDHLHVRAARGYPPEADVHAIHFDVASNTHLAQIMRDGKAVVVADTRSDPNWQSKTGYEYIRSWVGLPLWNRGTMIGSLNLDCAEPNAIKPEHVELLSIFAAQGAAAIERAQLFQQAQRRLTQLSALNRVAQATSSALELTQMLRAVHEQVEQLMDYRDFYVALYDDRLDEVEFAYYFDQGRLQSRERRRGGNGLTEYVIRTRKPLLIKEHMAEFADEHALRPGLLACSWMGVPLVKGARVIGVMVVQHYERTSAFDEEDLDLFLTLGDQIALAIENARLYETTRRNLQEADALFEFGDKAAQTFDSYLLGVAALSACDKVLGAHLLSVILYNGEPPRISPLAVIRDHMLVSPELEAKLLREVGVNEQNGVIGWVLNHREAVRIGDVRAERRYRGRVDIRSELCLPIMLHEQLLGVLNIESTQLDAFSERDEQFVGTLCAQLAAALQSARSRELERQRTFELQGLHEVSQAFAKMGDVRATYADVTQRIALIFNARGAMILRYDAQCNEMRAQLPAFGLPDEEARGYSYALDETALSVRDPNMKPFWIVNEPEQLSAKLRARTLRLKTQHFMGAAMHGRDGLLGVIIIVANRADRTPFSLRDGELLAVFARQAALAIENARLVETERISRAQLEVISQVGQRAAASLELKVLLPELIEFIRAQLNYHTIALFTIEADELHLQTVAGGMSATLGYRQSIREGVIGWVARNRAPRLTNEVATDAEFIDPEGIGIQSEIAVPLISRGEVIGVLDAASNQPNQFTESDVVLLGTVADQVAQAVANARLYERERQGRQQLLLVNRVARRILSINNLNALTQAIASAVVESPEHHLAVTFLIEGDCLVMKGCAGSLADQLPPQYEQSLQDGIVGWVARTGQTYVAQDVTTDPYYVDRVHSGIRSELGVPLRYGEQVLGVLAVSATVLNAFSADNITTLETVADQAAQAIVNVRAYENEQRRAQYMKMVSQIGSEITALLNLDDLLEHTAALIQERFNYDAVHIFLCDEPQGAARLAAGAGTPHLSGAEGFVLRIGEQGLVGKSLAEQRPILENNVRANPAYFAHPRMNEIESELVVPIRVAGRVLGALDVQARRRGAFTDDDAQIMQTLANQLAAAMSNAELHAAVEYQARTDSLTQVYNHGCFLQSLGDAVVNSRQREHHLALIMLDIDHFKQYNDRYGHVMGDRVLQAAAQAIRQNIKRDDIVGRWGGEEFGVALPNTTAEQAMLVAERIRETLAAFPLRDEDEQPIEKPTVSQGIAVFPDHALALDHLVDLADRMLYRAKAKGRDQIVLYQWNGYRP